MALGCSPKCTSIALRFPENIGIEVSCPTERNRTSPSLSYWTSLKIVCYHIERTSIALSFPTESILIAICWPGNISIRLRCLAERISRAICCPAESVSATIFYPTESISIAFCVQNPSYLELSTINDINSSNPVKFVENILSFILIETFPSRHFLSLPQ
jgi:hypothetical protein